MDNERTDDRPAGNTPTEDAVKDHKGANPAHPLPPDRATDTVADKVETDAEVEDRFEATDN